VHELLNVLKSGEIVIDDERRRIWKGLSFSVDDLVTHLAGDNFIADFLQAMQQVNHQFKFGSKVLSITSYALDILEVTKTSKIRYPYIGPAMSD
jgi:predicted SpoU family rRNA methylase